LASALRRCRLIVVVQNGDRLRYLFAALTFIAAFLLVKAAKIGFKAALIWLIL